MFDFFSLLLVVLVFGCLALCSGKVEQLHLAQGGVDSSSMTVMWITPEEDRASECYISEEAFDDPTSRPNAPARESIECRCMAIF